MKLAILSVLAVLALATAGVQGMAVQETDAFANVNADLGTALHLFLNSFKKIMPCGFPAYNIPVLAPFKVPYTQYNISTEYLRLEGKVYNLIIAGLNKYRVIGGSYNSSRQRFTFDMLYEQIQILDEEDITEWFRVAGIPFSFQFNGLVNIKFNDVRFVGEFSIVPNSNNPKTLQMIVHDMHFYIGEIICSSWNKKWNIALNNFINKWFAESLEMFSQQIQPWVTDLYRKYILPMDNFGLNQINMQELVQTYLSLATQFDAADCQKSGDLF